MQLFYGTLEDIENWMKLVNQLRYNFPGLETKKSLDEHKDTVLKFMRNRQAICVKMDSEIVGVMLFSKKHNMICCLGVSNKYRRCGIASMLLDEALHNLDRTQDISVSTFRENDEKGKAPRALYKKYGFVEDELIEEFGYPNQKMILHPTKLIEIHGANAYETFTKIRIACRGLVIKDSSILISHEVNTDFYMIPGGGIEQEETIEKCCIREVCEETGYIVKPLYHFLTIHEYYEDYKYISYYFVCDIKGKTRQNLTDYEAEKGLIPKWINLQKMLDQFAKHADFASINEEKRGIYYREYLALAELLKNT